MRTRSRLSVAVVAAAVLTLAGTGIAGAGLNGQPPATMELSSDVLQPGDTLFFGNSENEFSICEEEPLNGILQEDDFFVAWAIFDPDDDLVADGEAPAEGDWSDSWVVPDDATPGVYTLEAACFDNRDLIAEVGAQQELAFEYEPRLFTVVGEIEPLPVPLEPGEQPAEPVGAAPSFTG